MGDQSTPGLDVTLYMPHAGQRPVHDSRARFRIATCGRGFGKTTMGVNEIARFALANPGASTAWIAPVYKQAKIAFRWLCEEFAGAFRGDPNQSELRIVWRGGATTDCLSVEKPESIRGFAFDFIIGDEFATWQRTAWEPIVRPTLRGQLLVQRGGGRCLLVGTPKGRNLFWDLWQRGQDRERWPEYESWQLPSTANPYLQARDIREAQQSLPHDVFRQEYEAAFLEDSAGVFRNIATCERGDLGPWAYPMQCVIGWDPAKHSDASVITVLDAEKRHVLAFERILQRDYTLQIARVAQLSKDYHGALVLMDSTGVGDPLLEQLLAHEVPAEGYTFTSQTKQQLVEHLAVMVERAEITWPRSLTVLRNELEAFQYEMTRAGNVRYSAPEGQHDDCVMSLGLAAWAARHFSAGAPLALNLRSEPLERVDWARAPV